MIKKILDAEAAFDPYLEPYRVRADRIMVGMNWFLMAVCLGLAPINGTYTALLASGFMVFTGLIIQQSGGDIETHFSAFGLIGVLLYYRDWRIIAIGEQSSSLPWWCTCIT